MTTTGTRWSSAATAAIMVALLATLLCVAPAVGDDDPGGASAAPRTVVPEPATLAFVGVGAVVLFRRRRMRNQRTL